MKNKDNLSNFDKNTPAIQTFKSKVKYHSAHRYDNGIEDSLVEILSNNDGVMRVSDIRHNFLVKFLPYDIKNLNLGVISIDPNIYGPDMESDEYAGLVAINHKWTYRLDNPHRELVYHTDKGYVEIQPNNWGQSKFYTITYNSSQNMIPIGYIFNPENAMLNLFNNKLITIEKSFEGDGKSNTGMISIKLSDYDSVGYKCQFPSEFIFELSQKSELIHRQEAKTTAQRFDMLSNDIKSLKLFVAANLNEMQNLGNDIRVSVDFMKYHQHIVNKTISKAFPEQFDSVTKEEIERTARMQKDFPEDHFLPDTRSFEEIRKEEEEIYYRMKKEQKEQEIYHRMEKEEKEKEAKSPLSNNDYSNSSDANDSSIEEQKVLSNSSSEMPRDTKSFDISKLGEILFTSSSSSTTSVTTDIPIDPVSLVGVMPEHVDHM